MFARAAEHDLIVVATPNDSHVPLAGRAVELGIPVVVDKPLAPSAEAARALVDGRARRTCRSPSSTTAAGTRTSSPCRRLIDEGELGEVHRFESRFERWRPELAESAWREAVPARRGGGLLLDLGTHLVDQAVQLFGPVAEVQGEVDHRRGGPADDDVFIALRHESGVRSPPLGIVGCRGARTADARAGERGPPSWSTASTARRTR